MSKNSSTSKLLSEAADDYAAAATWREAAFQKAAETAKQDQKLEAAEDRRAGR